MSTQRPIAVEARSIPPHSNIEVIESSEPTESSALLPSSQSSIARPPRPIPTSILRKPTATRIIELLIASILLAFIIPSVQYFFDPLPAPESAVAYYAVYDSIQIISNTGGHTKVMALNYGPDKERIAVGFQLRSKSPRAYRSTHTRIDLINGSTLLINVTFPPPSLFYPSDIHIDLAIYIPRSLVSFNLTGESASLVWQAPPITSLFTMSVENGDFFTVSQLSPRNGLHIYTGNGRIDIDSPVTSAKSITLHSERGGGVSAAGWIPWGRFL
ncbi:hypothetical protein BCR33DRAFT_781360 [Rhizoclosmatium globosum]|uniref:Uncharacterized protein n=1 Tax=Rhizoclosmatium globosum TaxID=329046 RepID=A0A1Y2CS04_9FUNG|nr:hypothetical protein BCR33DRAFT_781360 [Rhizoclosmatium globosum]|eukprot:ORY49818.1 hypothetical protein BCR33DRAFT_781360 [Rhizoclosmatium globosum]